MDRARTGSKSAGSSLRYIVTILAAKTVGSSGTVISIDITPGMLRDARNKALDEGCAKIGMD